MITHLSLLKIQIPMNVVLMTKCLQSISVMDFKEVQDQLMDNSFLDVVPYVTTLIEIVDIPNSVQTLTDVETQISQYQFYEHGYQEYFSFFNNLRSVRMFIIINTFFILLSAIFYGIGRKIENWKFWSFMMRIWGYAGPNMFLRIMFMEYILFIFAGFVSLRSQFMQVMSGDIDQIKAPMEIFCLFFLVLIPLVISIVLPCISKEKLRKERAEWCLDTLYHKSNLRSFSSKGYLFILLV